MKTRLLLALFCLFQAHAGDEKSEYPVNSSQRSHGCQKDSRKAGDAYRIETNAISETALKVKVLKEILDRKEEGGSRIAEEKDPGIEESFSLGEASLRRKNTSSRETVASKSKRNPTTVRLITEALLSREGEVPQGKNLPKVMEDYRKTTCRKKALRLIDKIHRKIEVDPLVEMERRKAESLNRKVEFYRLLGSVRGEAEAACKEESFRRIATVHLVLAACFPEREGRKEKTALLLETVRKEEEARRSFLDPLPEKGRPKFFKDLIAASRLPEAVDREMEGASLVEAFREKILDVFERFLEPINEMMREGFNRLLPSLPLEHIIAINRSLQKNQFSLLMNRSFLEETLHEVISRISNLNGLATHDTSAFSIALVDLANATEKTQSFSRCTK